jgi:hypothetical protein
MTKSITNANLGKTLAKSTSTTTRHFTNVDLVPKFVQLIKYTIQSRKCAYKNRHSVRMPSFIVSSSTAVFKVQPYAMSINITISQQTRVKPSPTCVH